MNVTRNLNLTFDALPDGPSYQTSRKNHVQKPSRKTCFVPSVKNGPATMNTVIDADDLSSWYDWIGRRVSIGGVKFGILRYFGKTGFADGLWCGVELDEPVGKNNGTVKNVQYFTCRDNYGIFAPLSKTSKIPEDVPSRFPAIPPVAKQSAKSKLPPPRFRAKHGRLESEEPRHATDVPQLPTPTDTNANQPDPSAITEIYKTLVQETRTEKQSLNLFCSSKNNNVPETATHTMRENKLPVNASYSTYARKASTEADVDLLNQTVTLNNDGDIIMPAAKLAHNATFSLFNNENILNSTFSALSQKYSESNQQDITFILDECRKRMDKNCRTSSEEPTVSDDDLKSNECDESLGILSPDQMVDFTLSFESGTASEGQKNHGIQKIESCDDVNDLPEFEENKYVAVFSPTEACENAESSFSKDTTISNEPSEVAESKELLSCPKEEECPSLPSIVCTSTAAAVNSDYNMYSQELKKPDLIEKFLGPNTWQMDVTNANVFASTPAVTPSKCSGSLGVDLQNTVNDNRLSTTDKILTSPISTVAGTKDFQSTPKVNSIFSRLPVDVSTPADPPSSATDSINLRDGRRCSLPNPAPAASDLTRLSTCGDLKSSIKQRLLLESELHFSLSPISNEPQPDTTFNVSVFENDENSSPGLLGGSAQKVSADKENSSAAEVVVVCPESEDHSIANTEPCPENCLNTSAERYLPAPFPNEAAGEVAQKEVDNTVCAAEVLPVHQDAAPESEREVELPSDAPHTNVVLDAECYTPMDFDSRCPDTALLNNLQSPTVEITCDNSKNAENSAQAFHSDVQCEENIASSTTSESCSETVTAKTEQLPVCDQQQTYELSRTYSSETLRRLLRANAGTAQQDTNEAAVELILPEVTADSGNRSATSSEHRLQTETEVSSSCKASGTLTDSEQGPVNAVPAPTQVGVAEKGSGRYLSSRNVPEKKVDTGASKMPPGRKSMWNRKPESKVEKLSCQNKISPAKPKKTVVSKIKQMIDAGRSSDTSNQENAGIKPSASSQKKPGRWDAITSKITSGLTDVRSSKLKEVSSKINTNLSVSRQVSPKNSPQGTSSAKSAVPSEVRRLSLNDLKLTKTSKPAAPQRLPGDKSAQEGSSATNESRVLTQLQNVPTTTPSDGFKVPQGFPKKKRTDLLSKPVLPSPTDSVGSSGSAASRHSLLPRRSFAPRQLNDANKDQKPDKPVSKRPLKAHSSFEVKRESYGRDARTSAQKRWTPAVQKPEPRKFVSKTELVNQIRELGIQCESRTKELNLLKIQLRHATVGFEAFAILNKYMVEEFDPFSNPSLGKECEEIKEELARAGDLILFYKLQLENLRVVHSDELVELTEKLGVVHADEISELKSKHSAELAEVDFCHKQQVRKLKESFKLEAEENEQQHIKLFRELQEDYERQKQELKDQHAKKLREVTEEHERIQSELQTQLQDLRFQYDALQKQLRQVEQAFMKDKNSKIQYISSKKTELEKEVDSLKAVLDIKTSQIQDLHKENCRMRKELEELPIAKEKIRKLEVKTEDLKAMMQEKVRMERELSNENQQLVTICEKESKVNKRLSMVNEELHWRLQQSMEASVRSASLSGSPEPWNQDEDSFEARCSSSRLSLPILYSEKRRTSSDALASPASLPSGNRYERSHSMSFSWHPVLTTHEETPSDIAEGMTLRERSLSARAPRSYAPPSSKLSTSKLKRDIETQFLRRRSLSGRNRNPADHSMSTSWAGENLSDYYEPVEDNCDGHIEHGSKIRRKNCGDREFERLAESKANRRPEGTSAFRKPADAMESSLEMEGDKSLSGAISLQSSFTSDSSSSFLPTQTGSEESSCSTKSHETDSGDSKNTNSPVFDCASSAKSPRDLAGEAMVQDISIQQLVPNQGHDNLLKPGNNYSIADVSSSSLDEGKDKGHNHNNHISIATPSIDTSSQGMTDSMNLDVSWGDEEMPSEND